ncbi:MAG: alpha-amylase [Desulfatitalea sp. BRH_c12]|nr:MAG: alpha-amylase [Desulfatitalea sp. BRH_c12]
MPIDVLKPSDDPLWYKDAVIYQLHVKTFYDSDGDGIGDFQGLRQKLDYLQELGVTALWLLPFYPSPLKDDGYDISDFKDIHRSYGTVGDFKAFLRAAHKRGLKVITELVINHTSDQHPWFQRARRAKPGSSWHNFYVWSTSSDRYNEARVIFQDFETSNWTWDTVANAYYWHRFYSHQPDLNFENPSVHEAVFKALDFWLDMGVDGLRLDAVPYLYEREGTNCENLPETHAFLKKLRARMDSKYRRRMFLAEANQWPEDAVQYFGAGDECHMSFHFPLMPRLYMALYMENRHPVIDILDQTPELPHNCQWAIFLRNHDELTLEMVTDEERDYMYRVYAQDPRMRLNLGIRRRLSPLMGNHRRRIELMNGLLLSLPGTPVIYYGDEIGMGDNIYLGDRNGVRTPMQWSPDRNAGFSLANPQQLYLPVIIDPEYHYEVVNVESQKKNRHSLFWWMRRLITLRSRIKAFSRGSLLFLYPDNPRILAFIREYEKQRILVVVNFSRYVQFVELDLSDYNGAVPVEIFGNTPFPVIGEELYMLTLGPHSFYWFNLQAEEKPSEVEAVAAGPEKLPVFDVRERWEELFEKNISEELTRRLALYIARQRWFGAKSRSIKTLSIREVLPVKDRDTSAVLLLIDLQYADGTSEGYSLAVANAVAEEAEVLMEKHPRAFIARVCRADEHKHSFLVDGLIQKRFCLSLLKMIARRASLRGSVGRMTAVSTREFKTLHRQDEMPYEIYLLKAEQSNTSVVFGERLILKMFRRLQEGTNPDLEIGRFLTRRGFAHMPAVAGALEYSLDRGEPTTLAILQAYIPNHGDAWAFTLDSLYRFFESILTTAGEVLPPQPAGGLLTLARTEIPQEVSDRIGVYLKAVLLLAERTADMHTVLASDTTDPVFEPESFSRLYQRSLYQSMRSLAGQVLPQFKKIMSRMPEQTRLAGERILARREDVLDTFRRLVGERLTGKRVRCHGDYHLGQVLYTGKDFVIIDFEGEPARPISERKIKRSPLRDVAGMLRSFHYAADMALMHEQSRGLFKPERRAVMEAWSDYWYRWVGAAFLGRYLESSRTGGFLPDTDAEIKILLDAFLLEKAVYELGYEMNNRPDWVRIPLKGIEQLLTES